MLPDPVVPGVALASAPQPPTSHQARRLAVQDPTSASPGPQARRLAAEDLAIVVSAPGRAAGMLPDPVVPGEALAAATARALGVAHGPSDPEGVFCDDEDAFLRHGRCRKTLRCPGEGSAFLHHARPTASQQDPVLTVYAHNAAAFTCAVCAHTCRDLAALAAHRRTAHRDTCFVDHFHSGCTCGIGFRSRAAATKHAMTCTQSVFGTVAAARDPNTVVSPRALPSLPCSDSRIEEDPAPTGPLCAVVPAVAADASSATAATGAAPLQSVVPATMAPGHLHAPPVRCPPEVRVGGKRRRLNEQDDPRTAVDLDVLMEGIDVELLDEFPHDVQMDDAAARLTRWGPSRRELGATDSAQSVTGEATVPAPAVRRPLTPVVPGTRATRWGPCHRAIGVAAVAHLITGEDTTPAPPCPRRVQPMGDQVIASAPTLPSPAPPTSTITSATLPAVEVEHPEPPAVEPWTLRFDGACRRNPGPGGAGAALFDPSGAVVWTCSHFLPCRNETNNTAEYTALLVGVRGALHHGVTRLVIEGDSHLVLSQVRGSFGCVNRKLRRLRNRVRSELRTLNWYRLKHIDRNANSHADRLANRALDRKRTSTECGQHAAPTNACYVPSAHTAPASPPTPPHTVSADTTMSANEDIVDEAMADIEAEIAARDGGEAFPTLPIGPGSAPARQPRLRLRQLADDEHDAAAAALQTFAESMASRIADADSWATGEGYIGAIPDRIRELLLPYAAVPAASAGPRPPSPDRRRRRPPRVTRNQREHRLDEALDNLAAIQRSTPGDRRAMRKARRRAGRVRAAVVKQQLRQAFAQDEAKCVEKILQSASAESAVEEHPDSCPIGREELHRYFTGTSTAPATFDYTSASGQEFRAALDSFQPADVAPDAFTGELQFDEVEDQLSRATKTSSPGHDGIGYDVYRRFAEQLVPLLHAAFQFCWLHRRVPALWKVGFVRLIHKKGDPMQSTNWRPVATYRPTE
ncbi:unnamed protein product [Peronospora farinosa]|uniref:RNase H type-1 domain-containing protein n=1 Tax=Peronospora farinosa TaxID=134698 RepID=A0ABN8C8W7_9STRA|nr:unnamed protein product [Peronospora farinosa]